MQLSHYLKIYPWEESQGRVLLYSTKKASKILVPEETLQSIEKGTLSPSESETLSRLGMIVDDREGEKREVSGFFDRLNGRNSVLHLTVVLNLDCNFACLYCYEGQMKGKLYMSDETGDLLVRFIEENFSEQKKSLLIDFYGGEPLLSLGLIRSLSGRLKSFCEGRGASYSFTLVTNGSLLNRKAARELAALGLASAQITLDGPAENHDRYRPFKSGAGSFDVILKNIQENWDLVKITVGGNFDRNNYETFVALLDYLERVGLGSDKIGGVKFSPIINLAEGERSPVDYRDGCMSVNEPWLLRAEALLREEILKRGYRTQKAAPITCMVELKDSCVVNFEGTIYKCPAFIGRKRFAVGDLQSGIRDYASSYNLGLWKNQECGDCEYLPLCFGGCRYMSFLRDGNVANPDCKKAYLDNALERLVKQDIKYRRT
jgi:uncharacterized protein